MYFRDLLAGLRRRWYIVAVGLLITCGCAFGVTTLVTPQYTTTSSLLLLPPKSALGASGNPYLNLGGLSQALEVLGTRVNAADLTEQLVKAHPDATIEVGADTTSTGPILLVSVAAPTPAEATSIRDEIVNEVPGTLRNMQTDLGVRAYSQITFSTLAADKYPERDIKNLLRAVIVVVALGGALTFLLTGYLDFLLLRRRRRAEERGTANDVRDQSTEPASLDTSPAAAKVSEQVGSAARNNESEERSRDFVGVSSSHRD